MLQGQVSGIRLLRVIGREAEFLVKLLMYTAGCTTWYIFSCWRYVYEVEGETTEVRVIVSVYLDKLEVGYQCTTTLPRQATVYKDILFIQAHSSRDFILFKCPRALSFLFFPSSYFHPHL